MSKVTCLYTAKYLHWLYETCMVDNKEHIVDDSNTIWYVLQLEEVLLSEFGYEKLASGVLTC